jgi:hypothetical protein
VLAALGLIVALLWRTDAPAAVPLPAASPSTASSRSTVTPPPAPPPSPSLHLLERPTKLAPPAPSSPASTAAVAVDAGQGPIAGADLPSLPAPPDGPVDKRPQRGPNADSEHENFRYATETLDEDVSACLAEWRKVEPVAPQQVMIAFELDRDGLQRSWLDYDGTLPLGQRSCFANVVYGIDWSHIVDSPAKVTLRFGGRDAG